MRNQQPNLKVAVVTGGGSGIGFAAAQQFTQNGIRTVIVGRDHEKLNTAKDKLGEFAVTMLYDLSRLHLIPSLVENVLKRFDRIDILVNNAGINMKKDFAAVTDEEFQAVITTNLSAVFSLSHEVVKHMLTQGSGNIIHISSMAAQYGLPKVIAYSASKTAIESMTRAMAVELSPKGIRVNAIAPGFISSAMTEKNLNTDPERRTKAMGRTPLGYMGNPMDVAEAAYFLTSDASKYITGVVLPVDGGNSIGF